MQFTRIFNGSIYSKIGVVMQALQGSAPVLDIVTPLGPALAVDHALARALALALGVSVV